jgi:hypothetical protein
VKKGVKKFLIKYVIDTEKIKAMTPYQLQNELSFLITLMLIPIVIALQVFLFQAHEIIQGNDEAQVVDRCRITGMYIDEEYHKNYLCKSIESDIVNIIREKENEKLDENPYINRPVKIYADGRVK